MATYWLRIATFAYPSHLATSIGVTPSEFLENLLYGSWNYRGFPGADGEDFVIHRVRRFDIVARCDRRTDRQYIMLPLSTIPLVD